jgi:CubicO group peptidase (beta-lactamase class C family)
VPAKRAITIRDLLTHTAGISYGPGSPVEAEYKSVGAYNWYFADKDEPIGAIIDRLASVPFDAQPGEKWVYGFNIDILGRVVEVVSGQSLDEFFGSRIFGPLKMTDSGFFLPREKAARLATVYGAGPDGRIVRGPDHGREGQGEYVEGPRKCFSGGAGLLSTAHDYARLLQMLLNGGTLDGVRLLSPASVALMTANNVGPLYRDGSLGFGLGFEVVDDVGRAGRLASSGEYSWGSAYYSRYFVDPADGVIGIFLAQLIPAGGLDLQNKFSSLVYQAIVDR